MGEKSSLEGQRLDGKVRSDDGVVILPTKSLAGLSITCRGKSPYDVKSCHFTNCIIRAFLFLIWVIRFGDLKIWGMIWGMERRWRLFKGRRDDDFQSRQKTSYVAQEKISRLKTKIII